MSRSPVATRTLDGLIQTLAGFSSGGPGVTRVVYGDAWCDAHGWLAELARSLGLSATPDAIGNLFFHHPSVSPGDLRRSVLMIGSHLDTMEQGGRLDGAYGVITALLVAAELRDRTALPVVGFASCAGEENRFGECSPGARGILGLVRDDELDVVRDRGGTTWRRALEQVRGRGCAAPLAEGDHPCPALFHPALMLELHVELAGVLESEQLQLGIVDQVAGCRRMRVRLTGEARHAGTTPMTARRDALAAAAEMVLVVERLARKAGPPAVATAGFLHVEPGTFSAVPGACELGIEVRHAERAKLVELTAAIGRQCRSAAEERGIEVVLEESPGLEPVALSSALAEAAVKQAARLKIAYGPMASGAAHDAMVFARNGVPALLLFVPSPEAESRSAHEPIALAGLETGHRFLREFARWLTDARG
jgi:hydantoinase/carbamoylase family amidase